MAVATWPPPVWKNGASPFSNLEQGIWNHTKEVYRVKAHSYHIKRFILRGEIESHVFLLQRFYLFFKVFKKKSSGMRGGTLF